MSNRFHKQMFVVAVVSVACAVAALAQDAPPPPPNAIAQGSIMLIQLTDRLDTHVWTAGPEEVAGESSAAGAARCPRDVVVPAIVRSAGRASLRPMAVSYHKSFQIPVPLLERFALLVEVVV